jgi:hypothetical protein
MDHHRDKQSHSRHHHHNQQHNSRHDQHPQTTELAPTEAESDEKKIEENIKRLLALKGGHGPDGNMRVAAYFSPMKAEKLGWPGFVTYAR